MQTTGTHIAYFHLCHRKLWLFANGITMEQTSNTVAEGKLIGETSFAERSGKFTEIEIDGIKIDFYDARNNVVHEVKKSSSVEYAHIAQVKYYLYKLEQKGINGTRCIIEYPRLKQSQHVEPLTEEDRINMAAWEHEIAAIIQHNHCPPTLRAKICKQCSYYEFCYSTET